MDVLCFGDSITEGYFDSAGGWVERLSKKFNQEIKFVNLGVSGDSSYSLLNRISDDLNENVSDNKTIIIAIGVNDSRTKSGQYFSTTENFRRNLYKILEQAEQYSNKILFVGLAPCEENSINTDDNGYTNFRIKDFDRTLSNFCAQNNIGFVEILEPFTNKLKKNKLLTDVIHPNDKGHQIICDLIYPKLNNILST